MSAVLSVKGVTRRYGPLVAVKDVSVTLHRGEIHAIIGENGAGKSTLFKIAAGVLAPNDGSVSVGDQRLEPPTPIRAKELGVGMVHQHFMLVGAFRALENLALGAEPTRSGGRLDLATAATRVRQLMEETGLEVRLECITDELTVGERQRLEILRVLYRGAQILLLDEPTAVLSPVEAEELYATLRRLAKDGRAIAVVTHRLDEVVRFADRVTVMRRGRVVLERALAGGARPSEDELTRAIMGGEPPPAFKPPPFDADAPVALELADVVLSDPTTHRRLLDGIDLRVHAGEIVGVAGVEGNGQRELVRVLTGLEPRVQGHVRIAGHELNAPNAFVGPRARRPYVAVVQEDRHAEGLLLDATIADNFVLGDLGDPHDAPFDEVATVDRRVKDFQLMPPDATRLARELSGGNQQKIVVGRALDRLLQVRGAQPGRAVVVAQPTRGVDVGAAAAIHRSLVDAAQAGLGVLVISADLAELRRLSHRLVVIRKGRIVATFPPSTTEAIIGRAMLGMEAA